MALLLLLPIDRGSTHLPGSWLGHDVDCAEPGFQTSSEGPGGLGMTLALGFWRDPCACVKLEKDRLEVGGLITCPFSSL